MVPPRQGHLNGAQGKRSALSHQQLPRLSQGGGVCLVVAVASPEAGLSVPPTMAATLQGLDPQNWAGDAHLT